MAYLEKSDREYQEVEQSWESITSSHLPASQDSSWRQRLKIVMLRKHISASPHLLRLLDSDNLATHNARQSSLQVSLRPCRQPFASTEGDERK
jgi:hypothetical protein